MSDEAQAVGRKCYLKDESSRRTAVFELTIKKKQQPAAETRQKRATDYHDCKRAMKSRSTTRPPTHEPPSNRRLVRRVIAR